MILILYITFLTNQCNQLTEIASAKFMKNVVCEIYMWHKVPGHPIQDVQQSRNCKIVDSINNSTRISPHFDWLWNILAILKWLCNFSLFAFIWWSNWKRLIEISSCITTKFRKRDFGHRSAVHLLWTCNVSENMK